jgi:peroxiredoxin family protein
MVPQDREHAYCKRKARERLRRRCQKGREKAAATVSTAADGKTIIVFSGDLDRVLASFIIANGAAAMGRPVTMFFTFWGLNVLRKTKNQHVKKSLIESMFGKMMPRGTAKLRLSKMNMAGRGTAMMRRIMKDKNVNSLEELIETAKSNGVRLVAWTMSMDVMGIREEELIDGIELAESALTSATRRSRTSISLSDNRKAIIRAAGHSFALSSG